MLKYNNKYYKIGGKRLEVKEDKVHDDNYYLLTLAATAMTLERLHKVPDEGQGSHIQIQ